MKKTGIGLIGADFSLRAALIEYNYPREKAEMAAVCDRNPAMLELYRREHPDTKAHLYATYQELIADPDVDAVCVMVRDQYHEEIAVAALEAGKAVYLEKPMALSIEGCDRILETACRTGSKLFVGHNMRYVPSILKMKEVIDSGVIAEGKLADILLVDLDNPLLIGDYNLTANLVYSADSSCLDSLICDGRILMENRRVPGEAEILENARRVCRKIGHRN